MSIGQPMSSKVTDCEDCGGVVSKSAVSCPHCGRANAPAVNDKAKGRRPRWLIPLLIVALLIISLLGFRAAMKSSVKSGDELLCEMMSPTQAAIDYRCR